MNVELLGVAGLHYIVWPALACVFALGLLATFAPGQFSALAARGGKWIDTEKALQILDKPIDVDQHVLRYSRAFGVVVALAAAWLAFVYWTYFTK